MGEKVVDSHDGPDYTRDEVVTISVRRRVWDMSPLDWGKYLLGSHLSYTRETFESAGRPVWKLLHQR